MAFELHPQLAADTAYVTDLPLCHVLLMNNQHFPWLILVPRREELKELHNLQGSDYEQVMQEIKQCSKRLAVHTKAHKMNVAALGNMIPQLHIHIIARFTHDTAWPKPVWSMTQNTTYTADVLEQKAHEFADLLIV